MAWEKEDFKPKGIYSLVYERSRTSFVDSDAHREGAEVGGQVRGQGLVLPRWWTFCSPWAFVLGHKHCFFFFSCWGNLFLFLKMHKLQVIYFLFCSFSIQFAPGINSLPFSFCWGGEWQNSYWGLWIVLPNFCLPEHFSEQMWNAFFSDSKSLQVHSEVIWGLHSAFNLRKSSMNNLGSWNVTWEWRLWATN